MADNLSKNSGAKRAEGLVPPAEFAADFSVGFALFNIFALIELLLAFRKADSNLDFPTNTIH